MSRLQTPLVVDAGVIAKLYLPEPGTEQARRLLLREVPLHAPDLLLAEVANVLWKRARRGEAPHEHARRAVAALLDLPLRLHGAADLLEPAFEIAASLDRTVHDYLYVALAAGLDSVLITTDQRLHNRIAQGPLAGRTVLLEGWAGG